MDNPFSADNANPFQSPFQEPSGQLPAAGIKPFTAIDLAPPSGLNGNRHTAQNPPSASPFAGGDFKSAFMSRETPTQPIAPMPNPMTSLAPAPMAAGMAIPMPAMPAPIAIPMATPSANVATPIAAPFPKTIPFGPKPVATPKPDYTAVPMTAAVPNLDAARQSQILAMSDLNDEVETYEAPFCVSTTSSIEGRKVQAYLGVVSVEIVTPKDILFRNPAPYGELHRIKAAEDQLQKIKAAALEELTQKAKQAGADGIVGVTVQFSQFDAIVCLCSAVGTAVKLGA